MASVDTVRPYVEQLLREFCETDQLVVDGDGDVPIRKGSTMYWVSLFEIDDEAQVRVWSFMARDVPEADGLYRHLNEMNRTIRYGRVYYDADEGDVIVSSELLAGDLDPRELQNACECIGTISDAYDDDLVARFGGRVFFPDGDG
jgi:hypothetical protein